MLAFRISEIGNEFGLAEERWQAELHVQATFTIEVEEGVLLAAPHWAVVEQAIGMASWVKAASDAGPDYAYTSMDDAQEGLVTFTRVGPGFWVVGSAWQAFASEARYSTAELIAACRKFIAEVVEAGRPYMSPQIYGEFCSSVCG